jgi:hypothetical protein
VTVVIALSGSDLFDRVDSALLAGDRDALNTALRTARETDASTSPGPVPEEEAASQALSAPSYLDLRFAGRTLLSNLFATQKVDFARYWLPYAGVTVEPSDFQVTQFLRAPDSEPLELLVVAHEPQLSAPQRSLVRRLPTESREMVVGTGDVVACTPAALFATVTAGVVGAGVGYAIGRALQHFNQEVLQNLETGDMSLSKDQLAGISPAVSVQKLIANKRAALRSLSDVAQP